MGETFLLRFQKLDSEIPMSNVDPRAERLTYLQWPQTRNIGIQMKRKELTKIFMMISNCKKPLGSMSY